MSSFTHLNLPIAFQWDPKITTLPGLYVITVGILNPFSTWCQQIFCDPVHLRSINVLLSSLTCLILQRITTQIHGSKHVSHNLDFGPPLL